MEWTKQQVSDILVDHGFMPLLAMDDETTTLLKILIGLKYLSTSFTEHALGDDK